MVVLLLVEMEFFCWVARNAFLETHTWEVEV